MPIVEVTELACCTVDFPQNKIGGLFSNFDQSMKNASYDALESMWFSPKNDWAQETQKILQRRVADREAKKKDNLQIRNLTISKSSST